MAVNRASYRDLVSSSDTVHHRSTSARAPQPTHLLQHQSGASDTAPHLSSQRMDLANEYMARALDMPVVPDTTAVEDVLDLSHLRCSGQEPQ